MDISKTRIFRCVVRQFGVHIVYGPFISAAACRDYGSRSRKGSRTIQVQELVADMDSLGLGPVMRWTTIKQYRVEATDGK